MANPLLPLSVLLAAIVLLIQASSIKCWIPRLPTCRGSHTSGRSAEQQQVSLAASNAPQDATPLDNGSPGDHDPLFPRGDKLTGYVSRLEAMMDSDFSLHDPRGNSHQLLDEGERIVLDDWMEWEEWEESICFDGSCGDDDYDQCDIPEEYKIAAPKVDVMAFLGIRRADPLQNKYTNMRDWE